MRCGSFALRLVAVPSDEELKDALVARSWAEQEAIVAADRAVRSRPELLQELNRRAAARGGFLPLTALPPRPDFPPELATLLELNADNTCWVATLLQERSWLGRSLVGEQGADCAWMIVQHADRDRELQNKCLELLAEAVRDGEADPRHYAMLADRLRRADGRPQLYGTYCRLTEGAALTFTAPVDNPHQLAERRRALGLPDIATDEAGLRAGDSLIPYPPSRRHAANQWPNKTPKL